MVSSLEGTNKKRNSTIASRRNLVDATIACLVEEGSSGATVRKIATKAGVSVGLVNHHFPSVYHLLAEAYDRISTECLNIGKEAADIPDASPRERIDAFLHNMFSPRIFNPGMLRPWAVFWGLVGEHEVIRQTQARTDRALRSYLEGLFNDLNQEFSPGMPTRTVVAGLSSLIDGLWLNLCLQPGSLAANDALEICGKFIDGWGFREN